MKRKRQLCSGHWVLSVLVRHSRGEELEGKYLGLLCIFAEADPTPHICRASYKRSVPDLISDIISLTGTLHIINPVYYLSADVSSVGLDATDNSWKIFAERPLKDKALRSSLLQAPAQKLGTLRLHPQEMV